MTLNDLVKRLQMAMNASGSKLTVDGDPGPLTLGASSLYDFIATKRSVDPTQGALDLAIPIIKQFEGLRLDAYLDGAGVPTIGWGHTEGVKLGQSITLAGAEAWVREDVSSFMLLVMFLLTRVANNNQLAAFTSFAYNVGLGNFQGSTMLKLWNEGADVQAVADQFPRWTHDINGVIEPGLVTRRADEKALFLS